jgi:hypothetical protein
LRKELYGYATNHFRVGSRKGPFRAGDFRSSRFYGPSCGRWHRQGPARTSAFKCSREKTHIRNDEKALGGEKESCQGSIELEVRSKVEGKRYKKEKGIKRAAFGKRSSLFASELLRSPGTA